MFLDHSSASNVSNSLSAVPSTLLVLFGSALFVLFMLLVGCFALLSKKIQLVANGLTTSAATVASELNAQALTIRQTTLDLDELRKRLTDHNEVSRTATPLWATSDMPINLNRRGQVIRLSRKGKSIPEIAQDLNVAQGEVELLLKVHDLSQKTSEQGRS